VHVSPRLPWYCLLSAVILVPLVVGVIPVAGTLVTLNAFVSLKLIVLCLTLALSLGSWAVLRSREGTLYAGRGLVPVGVFLAVAGLSTIFGLDPRLAFFGDLEQGVGLLVMLLCGLACYLTAQLVRDEKHLATLTSAVIFTATAVAIIGLLQQVLAVDLLGIGENLPVEWIIQRGYGTIGNADTYAAYLVLPAFLALHRLRLASAPSDRNKWAGCFALILMSLVMAQTRAPIAGVLAGAAIYALAERQAARRPATKAKGQTRANTTSSKITNAIVSASVGAGVVAATLFATASNVAERFGSLESLLSLGGRIPLWTSAVRIAAAHPILGVGPDSFRLGWYPVREISHLAGGAGLVITDPHSVPLLIVATMGILGLLAGAYLLGATVLAGFRTATNARMAHGRATDYDAWLYGAIALSVTLLASLLTTVLLFMLFLALGVLIAPSMREVDLSRRDPLVSSTLRVSSVLAAVALVAFALLSGAGHLIASGARTDDPDLARARVTRAASYAPWDTRIRNLRYETMVQAALDAVFTDSPDAPQAVAQARRRLQEASRAEPHEYLRPYRLALLLIGAGQKLGAEYTRPGVEAGLRGLEIYPNSLELRTGVASGYLALGEPDKADALLADVWNADPTYLPAGLAYVESLTAAAKLDSARAAASALLERFPQDQAVLDLQSKIPSE